MTHDIGPDIIPPPSIADIPDPLIRDKVVLAGECWMWTGARGNNGYGAFVRRKGMPARKMKKTYAHRYMYETFIGPIPPKHEVHHTCYNRPCCNPAHLTAVTHAENLADTNGV